MKIKNLFGIALLATISLCANAQLVGGWQTPITTGFGNSGTNSGAGTNIYTTITATNYSANMSLVGETVLTFTNAYNAITNYDGVVIPEGGFSANIASGIITVSNAGYYFVQAKFLARPYSDISTNKQNYLTLHTNDVAVISSVCGFMSPVTEFGFVTPISSQILYIPANGTVSAKISTSASTNLMRGFAVSLTVQSLTAGVSSSSGGASTNLTGTNGITVTAGDPIVISQDGTLATTNDLSAYALTNTVPPYSLFSTQTVTTLLPIPDTNTLYLRGAGVVSLNSVWTWNSTMNAYTNGLAGQRRVIFYDGVRHVITNIVSTNFYSRAGSFDGQYEIGAGNGTNPPPFATFSTNGFTTNTTLVLRETVDSWNIFGVTFNGGDGFPPTAEQQRGYYVWSIDGTKWGGGTGGAMLIQTNGLIRDPALIDLGNRYALSYSTTISNTPIAFSNCTTVPLLVSTNLNHWFTLTNLDFALSGETLVLASNYCWSPVFSSDGSNLWIHASISTNSAANHEIRFRKTTHALYPNGWSDTQRLTNTLQATTHTNIIDLTPFYDSVNGRWYAWYKDNTTKYVELGIFNATPDTLLTPTLTGDHSSWGASVEGNWMVKLPNGKYRVFMSRYQGKDYGNNGTGEALCYSESTNLLTGWSRLTNCVTPFYMQSFKPIVVNSVRAQTHAQAATIANSGLVGRVNIIPEMTSSQGMYRHGWPFTNSGSISGINTNATSGLNIGYGNFGQGMFGMGDGSLHLYTRTFDPADTNQFIFSYAKTFLRANSNSIAFNMTMPISGNFGSASNIPSEQLTGSLSSNVLNGVRANFASRTWITNLQVSGAWNSSGNLTNSGEYIGSGSITISSSGINTRAGSLGYFGANDFALNSATIQAWNSDTYLERLSAGTVRVRTNLVAPGTITASNGVVLPWMEVTTDTNWNGLPSVAVSASSKTILLGTNYEEGRYFKIYQIGASSGVIHCPTGGVWSLTTGYATNFNLLQQTPTHLIWRKTNWIVW